MNKIDKFYEAKNIFQCPKCKKKIRFHSGGLVCKKEHRFDISSKGYVNLIQSNKPLKGYDLKFFQSRHSFFRKGYYDHIAKAVTDIINSDLLPAPEVILDAGCGEGFYSEKIAEGYQLMKEQSVPQHEEGQPMVQLLAFDIASDAIKVAAKSPFNIKWFVADITAIPVKDSSIDCILDVFTPANYSEFNRILKDDGIVIKVIPEANHMGELREAVRDQINNKEYSNEDVLDYFDEHFDIVQQQRCTQTMEIDEESLAELVNMTPLLFDVDKTSLKLNNIKNITVDALVLVGRKK